MQTGFWWAVLCAMTAVWIGCGGGGNDTGDGGKDAGETCVDEGDCDDGQFCNGIETCAPDDDSADARGCLGGTSPCEATQTCDEATDRCVTECAVTPDADGDGHLAPECGGDDCDDSDANAFPGNTEICDAEGHDEDCDPNTIGHDDDADGFVSSECCGPTSDGDIVCGPDCDDASASVGPTALEVCNGEDDDCDGMVDESLPTTDYYPDCDGDLYGDRDATPRTECSRPEDAPASCEGAPTARWSDDGSDCLDDDPFRRLACGACASVDVLLVVDNSNSMLQEQDLLAAELPRMATSLASGDLNADGEPDAEPIADMQLGVITTDMGTGGYEVPTCDAADFGDDAVLRSTSGCLPGCEPSCPRFLSFDPTSDSADSFGTQAACLQDVGVGGCGFEQPLEAVLKATTPSTSSLRFHDDTTGHADGENAGFLRDDAMLVVLLLTDGDDCSASDPALYDNESLDPEYPGNLNTRCIRYPEALHPVSRFVDGLLEIKPVSDLVFSAIVPVPLELVPDPADPRYATILAHPDMEPRLDPDDPDQPAASCTLADTSKGQAPRRIVQTAQGLDDAGAATVVGSICSSSFRPAAAALSEIVLNRLVTRCAE